jgi:hypothetical protein
VTAAMPRRRVKLELTLFPFLSVLSGLIAVMVLFMIVTISTRVISVESGRVEGTMPGAPAAASGEVIDEGIDPETYAELERDIAKLEAILAKRLRERDNLRLELREIRDLLDAKGFELEKSAAAAKPRPGLALGEPVPVRMIPARGADGIERKPVFIEVSSTHYVVHPDNKTFAIAPGPKVEVPAGLKSVIVEVARKAETHYLLLLIRTDGAEAFQSLLIHVRLNHPNLNLGWEPFSREWLLDTSTR